LELPFKGAEQDDDKLNGKVEESDKDGYEDGDENGFVGLKTSEEDREGESDRDE
jgi:hypothetical protein